jgi:DNA primase
MKIEQKLKMVNTYIYQYSLQTEQDKKHKYYKSRKIDLKNQYIKQIGYLSPQDIKKLEKALMDLFPIEDLLEFGVMKIKMKKDSDGEMQEVLDRNGNLVYVFKQYCFKGFCVIPNYDLYSNMITGLKFRNIELADWQPKSMKEPEMSRRDIVYPLPFALTRDMLLDNNACIFFVEGHVDGLSLPVTSSKCGQSKIDYEKSNTYFIASPGINGISEEFLGLLKGKFICLCFDQDEAGRKGAYGEIKISYGEEKVSFVNDYEGKQAADKLISELEANGLPFYKSVLRGMAEKLQQAGARVFIKKWDINLGGDVNELLQNGNLKKVFDI